MDARDLQQLAIIERHLEAGRIPDGIYLLEKRSVELDLFLREAKHSAPNRVARVIQSIEDLRKSTNSLNNSSRDPNKPSVVQGQVARISDHPSSAAAFLARLARTIRDAGGIPEFVNFNSTTLYGFVGGERVIKGYEGGEVLKLGEALKYLAKETRSPASEAARIVFLENDASVGAVASALLERLWQAGVIQLKAEKEEPGSQKVWERPSLRDLRA